MNYYGNRSDNKNIKFDFEKIYICLFAIIILFFFMRRLVRGADMTDEAFYVTIAYRLVKGNRFLADMWEQCSTSAVLPAVLLKIRTMFLGHFEGTVVFFRLAFFVVNLGAALILFCAQKQYLNKKYAAMLSLFYVIYAPFHMYTFSYNHQADMLMMLVINIILLAIEKENVKIFFVAGCMCAFLALTYPTMLLLCPAIVLLLWLKRKMVKNGWFSFAIGGFSFAIVTLAVLLSRIGIGGILTGLQGILSDPAYNIETIPIGEKIIKAVYYLFTPFLGSRGPWIIIYFGWLFIVFRKMKKLPVLKLSLGLYPVVVCMALFLNLQSIQALGTGMFIFYLSLPCPFMIFFTEKYKAVFYKFLYFEWLPAMLFYMVISISSYGGAVQAVQGLFIASLVILKEMIFIFDETLEELDFKNAGSRWKIKQWMIIFSVSIAIIGELYAYQSFVFRDNHVSELTDQIETGPYKGVYTTGERKKYLEEMTELMANVQEEDKSVCVLYQCNFVYLMLDMVPATPTAWGLYPHIDNQNVYYEYFKLGNEHVPEVIFVVDVPKMFDYCGQREEYYAFCEQLKSLIADNYVLTEEKSIYETGSVKKYTRVSDEGTFQQNLQQIYTGRTEL